MNCLELRYNKGGETKIVKIINQSDTDQLSDWDLLFEFLTTGNLPQNVSVEGATRYELLQYLLNELENSKQPLHTYMLFDKSGGLQSKQDVINKIIGNKSIKDVLYDTYLDDMFTHNCLYVSGWGAKTWYGFTDQRPLMITGRPRLNRNMTEHTLFTSYYELRQGSQFVTDIVNKLFDKYSNYESDNIYDKFTWLANNKLKETIDALYIPQYKIWVKNIHSELKKNIQQFIGYGIKYDDDIHIIKKRGNENNIIVTNIETNEDVEIPISSVYNLYEQFTVHYKNNTFYLFNKQWYYKKNKKFIKCPEGASNELFNYFFGLNDDKFESINVYNKDLKVTLDSKISPSNITLQESLPVGSYVRTSSGYYVKDVDGAFKKGDEILESNTTIYKVFYPKNDIIDEIERKEILRTALRNSKGQLLAPNGKISKLTEEQWVTVRTKAFKKWFGDWTKITQNEDGNWNIPDDVSKVIDFETGEPMIIFHYSNNENIKKITKKHTGKKWQESNGYNIKAIFFSNDEEDYRWGDYRYKAFLNIKNPGLSSITADKIPVDKQKQNIDGLVPMLSIKSYNDKKNELYKQNPLIASYKIELQLFEEAWKSGLKPFQYGEFVVFEDNQVYLLSTNTHIEEIKSLLPIKNSRYVLTQQDALIILSELFNFGSDDTDTDIWDHVKFSYDSEDIKVRTINDEVILDIGLKDNSKDEINLNKMDSLRLAVALFNNLRSDNPISIPSGMNVLDFWYAIEKYKLGDEVLKHRNKEYVLTSKQIESINLLKEIAGNSDENTNEWEEAVLENREQTMKSIHNENDAEWDTFINELINKGLYIISCKL